jgi:hypothetical protein
VNEESGWKLVHGDVFRPPKHLAVLAALLGTGRAVQVEPMKPMLKAPRSAPEP